MEGIIAFSIWTVCCLAFVLIGISAWRNKEPVGFFTFVHAPRVKNIKKYNHAVAKLWFGYAGGMFFLGLFLLAGQNSPLVVITIIGSMFLTITIAVIYIFIEQKYREK